MKMTTSAQILLLYWGKHLQYIKAIKGAICDSNPLCKIQQMCCEFAELSWVQLINKE